MLVYSLKEKKKSLKLGLFRPFLLRIILKENSQNIQIDFFSKDLDQIFYVKPVLTSGDLLLSNGQTKKMVNRPRS